MKARIEAPQNWRWTKVKHEAEFYTGWTPPTGDAASFEGDNLWANISDLGPKVLKDTAKRISDDAVRRSAIRVSPVESVLFSFKLSIGQVSFAGRDMYTNEAIATFPPQRGLNTKWAYWAFPVFIPLNAGENIYGAKLLNQELIRSADLLVPPVEQQVRIASFLDDKTARIDALIAEKERLLNLLAEQRLSVAEQVLAAKPGGALVKLGMKVDLLPGYAFSSDSYSSDETNVPLLRGVNLAPSSIRWDDTVYWPRNSDAALERFKLVAGDVVFGMDRPWISSGARVAMVDLASEGALLVQRVCRLRGRRGTTQRFIFYALASDAFRQSIEIDLTGVSVPHISPDQILRFKVPVLDSVEQNERCTLADQQIHRIVELEAQAMSVIHALHEYRSSLISAAVTGQLAIA